MFVCGYCPGAEGGTTIVGSNNLSVTALTANPTAASAAAGLSSSGQPQLRYLLERGTAPAGGPGGPALTAAGNAVTAVESCGAGGVVVDTAAAAALMSPVVAAGAGGGLPPGAAPLPPPPPPQAAAATAAAALLDDAGSAPAAGGVDKPVTTSRVWVPGILEGAKLLLLLP